MFPPAGKSIFEIDAPCCVFIGTSQWFGVTRRPVSNARQAVETPSHRSRKEAKNGIHQRHRDELPECQKSCPEAFNTEPDVVYPVFETASTAALRRAGADPDENLRNRMEPCTRQNQSYEEVVILQEAVAAAIA